MAELLRMALVRADNTVENVILHDPEGGYTPPPGYRLLPEAEALALAPHAPDARWPPRSDIPVITESEP